MLHRLKVLFFLSAVLLLASCKLAVIVVEGGEVRSTEADEVIVSNICKKGTICVVEVNDTNFKMNFYAIPDSGWYFQKWNSGDRLFCADSTNPVCRLSLEWSVGNAVIEEAVASSETFYLMPVFKPSKDTIVVDDKEWFQPSLFQNLSWNSINVVCPKGICAGVLNGYDMSGWTWASVDDLNALFNYYIGFDALGPGPGGYSGNYGDPNSTWASDFYAEGWRFTSRLESSPEYPEIYSYITQGWVRDDFPGTCLPDPCHYAPMWRNSGEFFDSPGDLGSTIRSAYPGYYKPLGAWFYRIP